MNKRAVLKRITEKVSDAHESMDSGLDLEKYNRKVGEVQALTDLRDWVVQQPDAEDVDDSELEELEVAV